MKLTPFGKLIIVVALLVAAFFAVRRFAPGLMDTIAPAAETRDSVVPERADLPDLPQGSSVEQVSNVALPGERPGCDDRPEVRFLHWAWNAQMGMMLATGGKQATEGSLMCKNGVNLKLIRQDDAAKM